ncbi:P-loop containing nucleoside triphosphate hydrolase protein [Dichotomocladium elegans]|nr:P-loop containing nucleoside triphosphate hydrolase protein [Dichotomocladium elegans]
MRLSDTPPIDSPNTDEEKEAHQCDQLVNMTPTRDRSCDEGSDDLKQGPAASEDDQPKAKGKTVAIYSLFRFATPYELFLIVVAAILSTIIGAVQPVNILIFGKFLSTFADVFTTPGASLLDAGYDIILIFVYLGIATLVASYTAQALWTLTGARQTRRIRQKYVHAILRQDMGWFDKAEEGSLTTRLATDTQTIQTGISEKFGQVITGVAAFVSSLVVAFTQGWRLALVILATLPLVVVAGASTIFLFSRYAVQSQDAYAEAGLIAEQVFSGIRTVYSFSLQERFKRLYAEKLVKARQVGIKRSWVLGLGFAVFWLILFCSYALAYWYGSRLVVQAKITGPEVFVVFNAMVIGSTAIQFMPTRVSVVISASAAASRIFSTIDRVPTIDIDNIGGEKPENVTGDIEFRNVHFRYPNRRDITVLKDLHLNIKSGKTVAIVGPSGSGKSTLIQLLQRFYDPLEGAVLLDKKDIRDLNLKWLRSHIGVVNQEPVLFNMTIRENLLMGVDYEPPHEEIIEACKKANCHTFISQMPDGYDTLVGEHGGMLSGGQKQRIAIARAILKNPVILLLDEATSALDTQSERLVQNALEAAAADRTTIVIAHRLSTIRNADMIVVLEKGELVEHGTHEELLSHNGVYAQLVRKQQIETDQIGYEESDASATDKGDILLHETEEYKEHQERIKHVTVASTIADEKEHKPYVKTETQTELAKQRSPMNRVVEQMRSEWPLLALGIICAGIIGAAFPCFTLVFAKITTLLIVAPPSQVAPGPMEGSNLYSFTFVMFGIAYLIGFGGQTTSFAIAGEKYTERLRTDVFWAYMRQEVAFFDEEEHSTGALTSKLAVDSKNVNEMITNVWADFSTLVTGAITGLAISFSYSWILTFCILTISPFIVAAGYYEFTMEFGYADQTAKANEQSGEVAGEAIREIRTVAALNKQVFFETKFNHALEHPHRLAVRKAFTASFGYALQQAIVMFLNVVAFYAGANFIDQGRIDFEALMICQMSVLNTAQGVGQCGTFVGTYAKAKKSALAIFEVLERIPLIDPDLEGSEPKSSTIRGNVRFKDVAFRYPSRPNVPVFDGNFSFEGKANQTIALVGPSGCGKSTAIGILQRWYDPISGAVHLDEYDIRTLTLGNLRSHMALVGQEPVLFDMTIGENILFGTVDDKKTTQDDVEEAAKAANVHNLIASLPNGYDTRVGNKGSQLSGGQKQRIAIARALIRKPKVLLLDEATSALDSESEKRVQEAIDNIISEGGRTTITIAHRLSTIQGADLICVVQNGRVVEQGTHWDLLRSNGEYAALVHQQSLNAH